MNLSLLRWLARPGLSHGPVTLTPGPGQDPPSLAGNLDTMPAAVLATVAAGHPLASARDVAREALVRKVGDRTALVLLDEAHFTQAVAAHKKEHTTR